jgi:rod shape determining protein RodA
LTGLWFSDYTLLLRRKWVPAAALLLFSLAPLWGLPFGWPFLSYKLMLYPTLLLPVPYAALVVSLRGRGTRAVLLCGGLALPLPIWAFVAISSTGYLVTLASMLLVLLAAVGLGWFRGKRRWNLLAALGPALTILPLLFLRHLEYAAWRIGAFLGPDLFYERLRMGELPSLFVGSSPELLLAETAQGLGRWVFWAAAGLIVLFAALLLRRIRALHSRTGKLLALSAFLPLFLQAAIYWLYNLGWWPLGVLSLPFLSYGVFFLLVDAALAGVLLSVFRMDALLRDTAWASSAPAPRPSALDIPLGRGQLHIEYRKGAQHF